MTSNPNNENAHKDGYRPDIDGLRAIAVLAVLFYHLGASKIGGGYVGVDIFFVITGFLFGKFALTPMIEGKFSFSEYYERRARRLFPAFLMTMVITCFIAFFLLLPQDLINFWKSVQAAFFFVSNIYFSNIAGYFDVASTSKPILHVWSLSIESQFYFLFPIIALVFFQWKKSLLPIWAIGICSFIISAYLVKSAPTEAYYLLTSRAWEILFGAYIWHISSTSKKIKKMSNKLRDILGFLGICLIGTAVFLFNSNLSFPGISALAPCIGAGAILLSGVSGKSCLTKILSLDPLIYIGKISYSLYLVHWPLIVFTIYIFDRPLNTIEKSFLLALILIIASAMHHFVETPFRKIKHNNHKYSYRYTLMFVSVFFFIGAVLSSSILGRGYDFRIPKEAQIFSEARNDWTKEQENCPDNIIEKIETGTICRIGPHAGKKILLWGDSHATAFLPAIQKASNDARTTLIVATTNGCPPVLDIETIKGDCLKTNYKIMDFIKENNFSAIIFAANWGSYNHDNPIKFVKERNDFSYLLAKTVKTVKEHTNSIVLIDQVPRYNIDVPNYLAKEISMQDMSWIRPDRFAPTPMHDDDYVQKATSYSKETKLRTISPKDILCRNESCMIKNNGISLYKDGSHLSASGVQIFVPEFIKIFKTLN